MRALVLGDDGVTLRRDWPEPVPAAGEVLVEVVRAGICETDLQLDRLNALGIDTALLEDRAAHAGADVVVECTGSETGMPMAIELVRPRGTIVLKTTIAGTQALSLAPIVVDEITIVGSRCGPFDVAIDALANGLVEVAPLVSDTFDLSDGLRALERAAEPGVMKVLLRS